MSLESGTFISDLVVTNPLNTDQKAQGAGHLRLLKSTVKATFPAITGAVNTTHTELNFVAGVTSAIQTQLANEISRAAPLISPSLTGTPTAPTAAPGTSTTQLSTTAFNAAAVLVETNRATAAEALKANIASPAFTGVPTAPTASVGVSTTQIASTAFVSAAAFATALPGQAGNAGKFLTTDGTNASFATVPATPEIITPINVSPANSAINIQETPTLTGSAFFSLYGATQSSIQVQISNSTSFTSPIYSSGDQAASLSFTIPSGILTVSTVFYYRIRYKNSLGNYSDYSVPFSFTTNSFFNNFIATPAATPAAFGDAFEGGFYTGLIFNELVQTSTSFLIGTGSKSFTVPSMSGAAIVYAGQTLEVRSRANPANKMIGTVTSASGTNLVLNITSVGGSGTYSDWSVMAQYRVIVAPKSSGENTSISYKNAASSAPAACGTLTEGRKATLAMVSADTSTVYPAAHFCNNLTIGSSTDWYLPARDELELMWRNLKPTTDANYVTADRSTTATPDYKNLGSFGDVANTHGLNNNSNPTGAAYTSGSPSQTSVTAFRTGGSEAFAYGSFKYWSSTEFSSAAAWNQNWNSSFPGAQNSSNKASAFYVRAVRRSII